MEKYAFVKDFEYNTFPNDKWLYLQCGNCNLISINPIPSKFLEEIYPPEYYSYDSRTLSKLYYFKYILDRISFKSLKLDRNRKLTVLDIGGGVGHLSNEFRKAYPNVARSVVIDLDQRAEFDAQVKGHEFICANFEKHDFKEKFDVILAFNILEHVVNPRNFLEKMAKILNTNGIGIIQTPNTNSLDSRIFAGRYWGGLHAPRHFHLFDNRNIIELFEGHNLEILKKSFIPAGPFWAFSVMALISNLIKSPMYKSRLFPPLVILFSSFDFLRKGLKPTSQMQLIVKKL